MSNVSYVCRYTARLYLLISVGMGMFAVDLIEREDRVSQLEAER